MRSSSSPRPSEPLPAPSALTGRLERILETRQAEGLPSLAAAVVRGGSPVWEGAVGLADCEAGIEATPAMQYRVGSITKTFTAVALMQLRDEGLIDLDDRLDLHLPGVAHGSATLRRMLSHLSGLQREPGEMWVTGRSPGIDEVLAGMAGYELVLPPGRAHHYSNLAFGLLGEVVARRSGVPYVEYVDSRILGPLELGRTTWQASPPSALGYLVDDFSGTVSREPDSELGGVASMGQLWSTVGDLARWGVVLAEGHVGVLAPETADELWWPQAMLDPDAWTVGRGIGIELVAHEGRVFGGHGGAMPGFLAGLYVNRATGTGAAVLTNSGARGPTREIALELAAATLELWPPDVDPWRPESPPPPEVEAILGHWWSEGIQFVFSWQDGKLTASVPAAPPHVRPAVFEPEPGGGYRTVSGRERGERLRVDGDRMIWAGYPFTRTQERTPD